MLEQLFELGPECSGLINEVCEHNCAKISGAKEGLNLFTASELRCCELAWWCLMMCYPLIPLISVRFEVSNLTLIDAR